MVFSLIVALVVAILAVIFAVQNAYPVQISFFALQVEGSLALVVLALLGAGFLIGVLVMLPAVIKRSLNISSQRKKIAGLEKELADQKIRLAAAEQKAQPVNITPTDADKPQPK